MVQQIQSEFVLHPLAARHLAMGKPYDDDDADGPEQSFISSTTTMTKKWTKRISHTNYEKALNRKIFKFINILPFSTTFDFIRTELLCVVWQPWWYLLVPCLAPNIYRFYLVDAESGLSLKTVNSIDSTLSHLSRTIWAGMRLCSIILYLGSIDDAAMVSGITSFWKRTHKYVKCRKRARGEL